MRRKERRDTSIEEACDEREKRRGWMREEASSECH